MSIRRLTLLAGAAGAMLLCWQFAEAHGQAQAPARVARARYVPLDFAPEYSPPVR